MGDFANNQTEFELPPQQGFSAVCVDYFPPEIRQTSYGPKNQTKLVFEIDHLGADGKRLCVWSYWMTCTSAPNAAVMKLLKTWGVPVDDNFMLETLIGRTGHLEVIHNESDDGSKTFANIALLVPLRDNEDAISMSPGYVRRKDKEQGDGGHINRTPKPSENPNTPPAAQPAASQSPGQTPAPAADATDKTVHHGPWGEYQIEDGKFKSMFMKSLTEKQLIGLVENFLPYHEGNAKPKIAEKRLASALNSMLAERMEKNMAAEKEKELAADDCPY